MSTAARVFTPEYRVGIAKRIVAGESISALSQQLAIKRSVLYRWRDAYRKDGEPGLARPTGRPPGPQPARPPGSPQETLQRRIAELERKVGQQQLENGGAGAMLTTDSRHPYWIYPNAAAKLEVKAVNQLWVADLTYIRLREQFLYLAVVLDAHSRRVVGWESGETLEAKLALAALHRALANRTVPAGIVHHSDRGIQYCSRDYIQKLEEHWGFRSKVNAIPG